MKTITDCDRVSIYIVMLCLVVTAKEKLDGVAPTIPYMVYDSYHLDVR